jgi:REP element-mobilizing transposase RayT
VNIDTFKKSRNSDPNEEQTGWQVHAYVLMSNHYHLLLETPEANLVEGMRWFQSAYTQRFNSISLRSASYA